MSVVTSESNSSRLPPSMVERLTLILDQFVGDAARLSLEEVARRTHLPRSTAHRILDQLVRLDWLEHSSLGYGLGARALALGGTDHTHTDVRILAAPHLHELFLRTGLTAHLALLDGSDIYLLDKIGGRAALGVPSRVGGRYPASATALGKAMLAWLTPEDVDELIGAGPDGLSLAFHAELNKVRMRRGLATERGQTHPQYACVAAAIRGREGPTAALSLVGPVDMRVERIGPLVLDAALQVSRGLFPGVRRTRAQALHPLNY